MSELRHVYVIFLVNQQVIFDDATIVESVEPLSPFGFVG